MTRKEAKNAVKFFVRAIVLPTLRENENKPITLPIVLQKAKKVLGEKKFYEIWKKTKSEEDKRSDTTRIRISSR
jgi:hypothetical protein